MPGTVERQNAAGANRPLLQTAVVLLLAWFSLAASPQPARRPTPSPQPQSRKPIARNCWRSESPSKRTAGSESAGQICGRRSPSPKRRRRSNGKSLGTRPIRSPTRWMSSPTTTWSELGRFRGSSPALTEEQAILSKLHGEGDSRVRMSGWPFRTWKPARALTPEQRRELREADRAYVRASNLYAKGKYGQPPCFPSKCSPLGGLLGEEQLDTAKSLNHWPSSRSP